MALRFICMINARHSIFLRMGKSFLTFLTGFLDNKNLSALISDDRTGVLIIPKGI